MGVPESEPRVGLQALDAVTVLLQRIRDAHPTAGLYEAADLQWWWRTPRSTDDLPQLFWFDRDGRPIAAMIATDWGDHVALAPLVMPDATLDWTAHVIEHGLAAATRSALEPLRLEADAADGPLRGVLVDHGFTVDDGRLVETWLTASSRPEISPLPAGYRLSHRVDVTYRPHHMIDRSGPDVEARLRQTSLYRPDLDLVIHDDANRVAAYGLFWYDPATHTGLVEPMRTEDAHQRRGLARHILATGVDLLSRAGAQRIKICYEPDNPASKHLYLSAGFEPTRTTIVLSRPTSQRASSTHPNQRRSIGEKSSGV
jgi:RimJ/RimL family protein N-acetyltransferase